MQKGHEWPETEIQMQNYYRRSSFSDLLGGSVVTTIVIINVLVFLLQMLLIRTPFQNFFALYPRLVLERGYIWQLGTYMFLHGGIFHLFFNMLIIWMFGTTLEQVWGGRRFLQYYMICGLGAAIFSFIFSYNVQVIGASGAGYGILLAYGVLFPYNQIYIWGIIPVRARTLVIVLGGVEFLSGLTGGDGIAHFAHLGGMAAGLVLLKTGSRGGRFFGRVSEFLRNLRSAAGSGNEKDGEDKARVDSILDKISEKGYENLSETEKRILDKYSEKKDEN
jgi:membrane associated rhomboid family serine protease